MFENFHEDYKEDSRNKTPNYWNGNKYNMQIISETKNCFSESIYKFHNLLVRMIENRSDNKLLL